jgi:hypothetical protein
MQLSLETSELMKYARLEKNLPKLHIEQLQKALREKSFANFAEIVIKESN